MRVLVIVVDVTFGVGQVPDSLRVYVVNCLFVYASYMCSSNRVFVSKCSSSNSVCLSALCDI